MKLRNKKTGEIASVRSAIGELNPPSIVVVCNTGDTVRRFTVEGVRLEKLKETLNEG